MTDLEGAFWETNAIGGFENGTPFGKAVLCFMFCHALME